MNTEQKLDKEILSLVKIHSKNTNVSKIKNLTFSEFLSNRMLMISAIQSGISYSLFNLIKDVTPFTESDWAKFLNISTKTLQRYRRPLPKKSEPLRFKPIQSEKIIELAEVTKIGKEVFSNMEKFKLWLNTPNFALGNMKPMELLKDSYGKEMVIGELTRIEHGIFV